MALLRCDFFSDALSVSTSMTVILPQETTGQIGMSGHTGGAAPPVLYLLHGLSDDSSTWLRRTSIERYVAPLGLAVVMPQVQRSYYTDEAYGGRYWTFVTEELPALVHRFFRVSDQRADTFVAGLSMGGYGAFKWALQQPHQFAAAASLSGALDVASASTGRFRPEDPRMFDRIFDGQPVAGSPNDLMSLLRQAKAPQLPALGLWCGSEDGLLPANRRFHTLAETVGINLDVTISPGEHEWGYWDAAIQEVLAWLPLSRV